MIQRLSMCWAVLLLATATVCAQDYQITDLTYVDNIKTVRMHVAGFPYSLPVIDLNGSAQVQLSFDDLDNEVRRYRYRVIHCDMNWQPSSLGPLEYNDGFEEDQLTEFNFNFRTFTNYVHYDLRLPNNNVRLTKSGNYLLVVFEDEDDRQPVITRRFMVVEPRVNARAQVVRPTQVNQIHTHQEVDFAVSYEQFPLRSPMQEIRATVLQNGRWDNAVVGLSPTFLRSGELIFDYQGKVVFAGGNEFRNLDMRSIQAPATPVAAITVEDEQYNITLTPDVTRADRPYLYYFDLNGDFINLSFDRPLVNLPDDYFAQNWDRLGLDYTGEYTNLLFTLKTAEPFYDYDMYLFGAMTEWKLKPSFKLTYNPAVNGYVGRAYLKQGFYNYWYVLTPNGRRVANRPPPVSVAETEGSFTETENDYLILVYYRPFGGRYDQLIGSYNFRSQ